MHVEDTKLSLLIKEGGGPEAQMLVMAARGMVSLLPSRGGHGSLSAQRHL